MSLQGIPEDELPQVNPLDAAARPAPDKSRLVRISSINYGLTFLIDFAVTTTTARWLTPGEIGIFSVAMASIVLTQILRTAGVNIYILQARELNARQIASALGLTFFVSILLGLGVAATSGPIAAFYREPGMRPVLLVSALGFLFVPLQSIASGILMRDLRMSNVAVAALTGTACGGLTTVLLAYFGFGAMSMAVGALVNVVLSAALSVWYAREKVLVRPRLGGWLTVWSVSGWAVGGSAINQLGVRLNELAVGRTLGLASAAMLDRAEMVPRMVWSYIAPALLGILGPLIASEIRSGADVRELLVERMRYFSIIFVPVMAGMSTQGHTLILTLFGPQWVQAIPSVFWLCINGAVAGLAVVIGSTFSALGRTRQTFMMSALEQLARVAVLVILARTDIVTIARGMVFVGVTYFAAATFFAIRCGILQLGDLWQATRPALITSAGTYIVGQLWNIADDRWFQLPVPVALATAIGLLGVTWFAFLWSFEPKLVSFGLRVATGR
jgi:O-antigen/teichoic acid export membrane protein